MHMPQTRASSTSDEEFLYELLDRAMSALEDGGTVDLDRLLGTRIDLREQALRMVRLAGRVAVGAAGHLPALRGFAVLSEVGRGGMGTVYLARQERLGGRLVALKVLPASAGLSPRARERFSAEALSIAKLRHPNIVAVYDVVRDDNTLAYAMEWVEGQTLADWIAAQSTRYGDNRQSPHAPESRSPERLRPSPGKAQLKRTASAAVVEEPTRFSRLDIGFVCRVGVAISRALQTVHDAGLLHRDVKPGNILIRGDGTPLLSDFGLAREADSTLSEPGNFAGTVAYAPPEQLRGDANVDARSDVYALGVTLYHALARELPFTARDPVQMLRKMEAGLARPLRRANARVPRDLETVISRAMEPHPARRYQTAAEFADELERVLNFEPIRARRAGLATRALKFARRNRRTLAASIVASMLTLILAGTIAGYAVAAPRMTASHLREARLSLLDHSQAVDIVSDLYWGSHYAAAPAELERRERAFRQALREYDAALRWTPSAEHIRREKAIVAAARAGTGPPHDDLRSAGLYAFLRGEYEEALRAWAAWEAQHDPLADHDPLLDGALGVLHLFREQPARAYPRLMRAVQAFPDVGFLREFLADAALKSADLEQAERWLEAAGRSPRRNLHDVVRIRAAFFAARGANSEAERLYREAAVHGGAGGVEYARFLEARGRREEALDEFRRTACKSPGDVPRRAYCGALDRWWSSLSAQSRLEQVHAALYEDADAERSLVNRLRTYLEGARELGSRPESVSVLPTIHDEFRSPSIKSLSLSELANRMEVTDMYQWATITSHSPIVKKLHFYAWHWPILQPFARWLRARADELPRAQRGRSSAVLIASLIAANLGTNAALAQSEPGPGCLSWEESRIPQAPEGRRRTGLAFDAARGVVVLFGGTDFTWHGDTWVWDGATWTLRSTTGPSAREDHAMAYDSARGVVVLHGGYNGARLSDTWEWDGNTWSLRTPNGPCGAGSTMAYDEARNEIILFGGVCHSYLGSTYAWNGTNWALRATTGPSPREYGIMAFDNQRQVIVLFGGSNDAQAVSFGDTWEWDGAAWALRTSTGPAARNNNGLAYHAGLGLTLCYGGHQRFTNPRVVFSDLWAWDGTVWTAVTGLTSPPGAEHDEMVYDPLRNELVLAPRYVAGDGSAAFTLVMETPTASAGSDQTVAEQAPVQLDGSQSSSPCGDATYTWTQVAGDTVTLDLANPARPTFTAPFVPAGGATLTFQLVVHSGQAASAADTVDITVMNVNHAPVAEIDGQESGLAVAEGSPVTLDGSGSYDPDGETITYAWVQTGGPAVDLVGDDTAQPTFTAPFVGHAGETRAFQLIVNDGAADSEPAFVQVRVEDINHEPTAIAGPDQTRDEGATVTLDGSASSDPDSDSLSYAWVQVGGPAVMLSDATSVTPSFTAPDVPSLSTVILTFQLTVDDGYDGEGGVPSDTVTITVQDTNAPPVCTQAQPSAAFLWPPNHRLLPVSITGVSDPENASVMITITGVTQDEPVNGTGDGDTGPDALIQGSTVLLRAERAGSGNGRVYRVSFTADDGAGGVCNGSVTVCVPRDRGRGASCVDDGQNYSSE